MNPMPEAFAQAGLFPSTEQALVIDAALAPPERALQAYAQWRAGLRIDDPFDHQVFRLLPLMYHRLHSLGVQDDLTGRLKGTYRQAWARNHQLVNGMRQVVAALSEAGIRTLLLKGAPLALAVYRNLALRPMDDIDIAIRREDLERALAVLARLGYQATVPIDQQALRYRHAVSLVDAQRRQVDLHWDIMHEVSGTAGEAFWADTESLDFAGQPTETLAPTSMLLHTVIHGVRWNMETPVRWIPDAAMLLRERGKEIEWSRLVRVARARQLTHRLGLGLRYLRSTTSPEVPEPVVQELEATSINWLQRLEQHTILRDQQANYRTTFGPLAVAAANVGRRLQDAPPWQLAWGLAGYLRHHWGDGRWSRLGAMLGWGAYTRFLRDPVRRLQARWARVG